VEDNATEATISEETTVADSRIVSPSPTVDSGDPPRHRWLILAVVALAQLMVVLDATIVNIALPSAQRDLLFATADRQWVVTAYSLAFGGLLLVGGRLSDILGRRTTFTVGLIGFAAASALGGAAAGFTTLVVARAVQGVFAALLAPSALSLLITTFTGPRERRRALGVYTSVAGAGGAIGLLLGGVLTEYVSWRWCLYVNVAFAVAALIGAQLLLTGRRRTPGATLDVPGSLLAVAGLVGIVYGLGAASTDRWSDPLTVVPIVVGVALLVGFLLVERRATRPLVPLNIPADRTRGAAYLGAVLAGLTAVAMFLLLTYYLQGVLGFTPLRTGVAFLPFVVGAISGANLVSNVALGRLGPRIVVPAGLLIAAVGAELLARIDTHSGYGTGVAPAIALLGFGVSAAFTTAFSLGPVGVAAPDAGIASALVNSGNQIGGSVGAALLNTLATNGAAAYLTTHPLSPSRATAATLHGNAVAFTALTAILVAGAVATGLIHRPTAKNTARSPW
jgi:EmrB/QacA subfamily drug resistance transporter